MDIQGKWNTEVSADTGCKEQGAHCAYHTTASKTMEKLKVIDIFY